MSTNISNDELQLNTTATPTSIKVIPPTPLEVYLICIKTTNGRTLTLPAEKPIAYKPKVGDWVRFRGPGDTGRKGIEKITTNEKINYGEPLTKGLAVQECYKLNTYFKGDMTFEIIKFVQTP